jgi:hypothetical protein
VLYVIVTISPTAGITGDQLAGLTALIVTIIPVDEVKSPIGMIKAIKKQVNNLHDL